MSSIRPEVTGQGPEIGIDDDGGDSAEVADDGAEREIDNDDGEKEKSTTMTPSRTPAKELPWTRTNPTMAGKTVQSTINHRGD